MSEFTVADLKDMQGTIFSGYAHLPYASYLFVQITDSAAGKAWLGRILPLVTTAERWPRRPDGSRDKPARSLNIGINFAALQTLGLPQDALNTFEPEFIAGVASRAKLLGDTKESAPENWDVGGPTTAPVHVLLVLNTPDEATLDEYLEDQRKLIGETKGGVQEVNEQRGHRPPSDKEPFGFQDGISQPDIERSPGHPEVNRWVVKTGEFVLGYLNAYNEYPLSPGVPSDVDPGNVLPPFPEGGIAGWKDLGRHGTFMVYRKLQQDIAGFWSYMAAHARRDATGSPDVADMVWLASKCFGRWPSGAPLVLSPDYDCPALGKDPKRNNDFLYQATDDEGYRCPLGAHIRRVNPRDSRIHETVDESIITSNRHRVQRRAVSFGKDLFPRDDVEKARIPLNLHDDGQERGIHMIFLNASIRAQFELIQRTWANEGSLSGLYNTKDPIIGDNDGEGQMTIELPSLRKNLPHVPRFVKVRGAGYFFVPSLTALRFLAGA